MRDEEAVDAQDFVASDLWSRPLAVAPMSQEVVAKTNPVVLDVFRGVAPP